MPQLQLPSSFTAGRAISIAGQAYAQGASIPMRVIVKIKDLSALMSRNFIIANVDPNNRHVGKQTRPIALDSTARRRMKQLHVTPLAPTSPVATAGHQQATVSFTPPTDVGGSSIISYTVTSSTGHSATGVGSPITVTGLTTGTATTFTVTATNQAGQSPASVASNSVTPS